MFAESVSFPGRYGSHANDLPCFPGKVVGEPLGLSTASARLVLVVGQGLGASQLVHSTGEVGPRSWC